MKAKKRNILSILLVLLIVITAGCSGSNETGGQEGNDESTTTGGTLIVGATGDPQTFNPDARADDYYYAMAQNIFSRLVKINNNQEIIPDLAKEWEFNEEGTEITFHLQENVKWHDGEDFSSADVKFTLDSIMEKSGYAVGNLSSMEEVTTPDENTVVIHLKKPDASFLGYLAWYATFIVPEHIYSGDNWDSGLNINPVGTGPFKFVEHTPGVSVTLERFDDYFGQVAKMDKVVFSIMSDVDTMMQAFYNGELDVLGTSPPSSEIQNVLNDENYVANPVVWPSRQYLVFNMEEKPLDQLEVRQAIAYALDSDDIVNRALRGEGQVATSFVSPVFKWAVSDEYTVPEYDPEKAKGLLEEAGLKPDANGNYLSLTLDVFQDPGTVDMATVIKDQLRKVGIEIKLNVSEYPTWQEQVHTNRKYQLSMIGGYQGPDIGAISARISTEGSNNFNGYSNPELDELLEKGASLVTDEDRKPIYNEVQRILSEDLPIYLISEWVAVSPVHVSVKGMPNTEEALPYTGFNEYNYVWIDK